MGHAATAARMVIVATYMLPAAIRTLTARPRCLALDCGVARPLMRPLRAP